MTIFEKSIIIAFIQKHKQNDSLLYNIYIENIISKFFEFEENENIKYFIVIEPYSSITITQESIVTGDFINHNIIIPTANPKIINFKNSKELEEYDFKNSDIYFCILTSHGKLLNNYYYENDFDVEDATNKINYLVNNFSNSSLNINFNSRQIKYFTIKFNNIFIPALYYKNLNMDITDDILDFFNKLSITDIEVFLLKFKNIYDKQNIILNDLIKNNELNEYKTEELNDIICNIENNNKNIYVIFFYQLFIVCLMFVSNLNWLQH